MTVDVRAAFVAPLLEFSSQELLFKLHQVQFNTLLELLIIIGALYVHVRTYVHTLIQSYLSVCRTIHPHARVTIYMSFTDLSSYYSHLEVSWSITVKTWECVTSLPSLWPLCSSVSTPSPSSGMDCLEHKWWVFHMVSICMKCSYDCDLGNFPVLRGTCTSISLFQRYIYPRYSPLEPHVLVYTHLLS